ncbi:unnamed protein product [Caenorhabditis auriculariae]|uniref:Peptidase S1 domain-containing protein n=1 Tax=Caenorhabditis auriculariae TaxID=2777116 RepID=A0A8S1H985_9PELO|nr:unnamed protein product [Caenorhabditis auriculariae]
MFHFFNLNTNIFSLFVAKMAAQTINIRSKEREIELDLPDNTITKSSIKSALLLTDDAIVSLSYELNGRRKFCRVNESGTTFLLPDQFPTLRFSVESDKTSSQSSSSLRRLSGSHRERSESPYVLDEKLADELRTRLFFIPRGQKALQDEKKTSAELVIVVDTHHDFVILRSVDGKEIFEDYPYSKRSPKTFESFIGFGLSHETEDGQQITHRNGRICSDSVDHRGRFLASTSIDAGDSGGPCYSADRALIGIMVASTTTDPWLRTECDRESIEEELIKAPSHPADTWITPAPFIAEAYKNYQVKHGILLARPERSLREPKAKRRAMDTL